MSELIEVTRASGRSSSANPQLEAAARAMEGSSLEYVFRLWIGDNFRLDGRWKDAIRAYQHIVKHAGDASILGHPIVPRALEYIAHCKEQLGDVDGAVEALVAVTRTPRPDTSLAGTWFHVGTILGHAGRRDEAIVAYSNAATASEPRLIPTGMAATFRERAMHEIALLVDPAPVVFRDADQVVRELSEALQTRDGEALLKLASRANFTVGAAACDGWFATKEYLAALAEDLSTSPSIAIETEQGNCCGGSVVLKTNGWVGKTFVGTAFLTIEHTSRGWAWTGVGAGFMTPALQGLIDRQFGMPTKEGNQPPEIPLKAPWPAGTQNFAAGGLNAFLATTIPVYLVSNAVGAAQFGAILSWLTPLLPTPLFNTIHGLILAADWAAVAAIIIQLIRGEIEGININANELVGLGLGASIWGYLIALAPAIVNPCGFGVRGLFYGQEPTHTRTPGFLDSFFAIDFSRNARGFPFVDSANGEFILAVADGIVIGGNSTAPNGSRGRTNYVELAHVSRDLFWVLDMLLRDLSTAGTALAIPLGSSTTDRNNAIARLQNQNRPTNIARAASAEISRLSEDTSLRRVPEDPRTTLDPRDDPRFDATNANQAMRGGTGVPSGPLGPTTAPIDDRRPSTLFRVADLGRYSSRYLHLQTGTAGSSVSLFQMVVTGNVIGRVGSTGRSQVPHLHFELHDRNLFTVDDSLGQSIRPSPLDQQSNGAPQHVNDGDCLHSSNVRLPAGRPRLPR